VSSVGWTVKSAVSKPVHPDTGEEIDIPADGLSETGEPWFKGPNVMAGYLGNERLRGRSSITKDVCTQET
jgi:long-subunit acyl-CoA synthetase (AMP-forming)